MTAQAGVAKGLLWRYFADGEDLMEQAARHTLVALRAHRRGLKLIVKFRRGFALLQCKDCRLPGAS